MKKFDKLLNAIASTLTVQSYVDDQYETPDGVSTVAMRMPNYRDVTDEVKELFKQELKKHMSTKLEKMKVGEHVEYGFDYSHLRRTLMEDMNDNLKEVLLKLPALNEGEKYNLRYDTYLCVTLTKKEAEKVSVTVETCQRIMEAYENQ